MRVVRVLDSTGWGPEVTECTTAQPLLAGGGPLARPQGVCALGLGCALDCPPLTLPPPSTRESGGDKAGLTAASALDEGRVTVAAPTGLAAGPPCELSGRWGASRSRMGRDTL